MLPVSVHGSATALIDVWALPLRRAFGVASLDFCMLGRWVRHMPRTFVHDSIGASPPKRLECVTGWAAHYSIGVAFAWTSLQLVPTGWTERPTLLPALAFGIATVIVPMLTLQPAFGLGGAGAGTRKPHLVRLKSVLTHTVVGVGLHASALGFSTWPFR